jgi:hypothetical protein
MWNAVAVLRNPSQPKCRTCALRPDSGGIENICPNLFMQVPKEDPAFPACRRRWIVLVATHNDGVPLRVTAL